MVSIIVLLINLFLIGYYYYRFVVLSRQAMEDRFVLEKLNDSTVKAGDVEKVIVEERKNVKEVFFIRGFSWKYNPKIRHELLYRSTEYATLLKEYKMNRYKSYFAIFICILCFMFLFLSIELVQSF